MCMTDPIADYLTRIRNAGKAGHAKVDIPASNMKKDITKILFAYGYIKDYLLIRDSKQGIIRVFLKFHDGNAVITGIKRISKPGQRRYADKNNLPRVFNNLGIAILSTSSGILSDRDAGKLGVGGEVLCHVW